uniref:Uncharacterized protein n=1 Tax=Catagonus wagneri TaxID=51154 RepID=A0A8C3X9A5_9CETA
CVRQWLCFLQNRLIWREVFVCFERVCVYLFSLKRPGCWSDSPWINLYFLL